MSGRAPVDLVGAGASVPVSGGGLRRFVNFDYAASAPAMVAVQAAVTAALEDYASIHRGHSVLSARSTEAYEGARESAGRALGARDDDSVVFVRNTTDALNLLASAVPGRVVHLDIEHHANMLPWRATYDGATYVQAQPTVAATLAVLEAELAAAPTALLALTGASNVTGECLPLPAVADLAHAHGARLLVDGAQLAPHRAVDIAGTGIDYFACSGHKLYAPFGAGLLIGRPDWLDAADPWQLGGGAVLEVGLDDVEWKSGPARHEGGTPNLLGAVALAAALETMATAGFDAIAAHEAMLRERLVDGLAHLGITPLRIWPELEDVVGVVTFNVPGHPAREVGAWLSDKHAIGVRSGRFCAHPLLNRFGPPDRGAIRASLGLGTRAADIDALLDALAALIAAPSSLAV